MYPARRTEPRADMPPFPLCSLVTLPHARLSVRAQVVHARARRKFQRGLKRKPLGLIKKLRKAKTEALPNEKPAVVKTHLRDMIIVPEMIGSVIGIYNGKVRAPAGGVLGGAEWLARRCSTLSRSSRR
jgi:hypothetical protein